jgi:DICT domain-containing protein
MDNAQPTALSEFFEHRGSPEWSAQIVNRTNSDLVQRMVEDLFGSLSIDVSDTEHPEQDDNLLMLLRDGEVVETSTLETLKDTLLMVNSDFYRTGTTSLEEIDSPDVITLLSDTLFELRGYPESNTEKLVLILVSRYIEYQAWAREAGTLRTSFQRLSLLDDERGTREVYDRLGDCSGLDVHVYGIPDWDLPESLGVTVHGISDEEISQNWFVIYGGDDRPGVAMLAVEVGPNEWHGFWTFDRDEIGRLNRYVKREY